ncbi:hypothetical protein V8E54_000009 [Elaphomyces granulatus]
MLVLLPIFGVAWVSFVIWETFYPVPGFTRPTDSSAGITVQFSGLAVVTWRHASSWHRDTGTLAFASVPLIKQINGTETKASVVIPLGEETVEEVVLAFGSDDTARPETAL